MTDKLYTSLFPSIYPSILLFYLSIYPSIYISLYLSLSSPILSNPLTLYPSMLFPGDRQAVHVAHGLPRRHQAEERQGLHGVQARGGTDAVLMYFLALHCISLGGLTLKRVCVWTYILVCCNFYVWRSNTYTFIMMKAHIYNDYQMQALSCN